MLYRHNMPEEVPGSLCCVRQPPHLSLRSRVLESAASVLQLASMDAHSMAALGFGELLQRWGRGAIRKRFHELSMQVHPDKCNLPQADQASVALHTSSFGHICDQYCSPQAPTGLLKYAL